MVLKLKCQFTCQTIYFSLANTVLTIYNIYGIKFPDMCVVQFIDSMTVANVHKTTIFMKLTDLSAYLFFKLLIQCQR